MTLSALLPNGFNDLLPDEAEAESHAIQTLMNHFQGFGYARIKPPLAEFEDTLLARGPGESMAPDTFRVVDSVSHKMLGIRADITPQIARIVSTRLRDEPKPLRLCYANDVLRARAGQLRNVRQFTQVGCEMVGDEQPASYVELVMLAVLGLSDLGIKNITIDFTMPMAFEALYREKGKGADKEALERALTRRDQSALRGMAGDLPAMLLTMMEAAGDLSQALPVLKSLKLGGRIGEQLSDLEQLHTAITKAAGECGLDSVRLSFDAFETRGQHYYKGLAFSLFSEGVRGELGRGGHYGVQFGQGDTGLTATGFTLYMDTIRQVLSAPVAAKRKMVSIRTSWEEVQKLREQGWTVIFQNEANDKKRV